MVALRLVLAHQANLLPVILLLALYTLLYALEPWLSSRSDRQKFVYFPLQTITVIALSSLRPFSDMSAVLYVPLCLQVLRGFSRRTAAIWLIFYTALIGATLLLNMEWVAGLALFLLFIAVGAFIISYDLLYSRTQADQAESQRLLADLQSAHRELQEHASQAEELAAARRAQPAGAANCTTRSAR